MCANDSNPRNGVAIELGREEVHTKGAVLDREEWILLVVELNMCTEFTTADQCANIHCLDDNRSDRDGECETVSATVYR